MLKTYLLISLVSVMGVAGQISLKMGMNSLQNIPMHFTYSTMIALFTNVNILAGVFISAAGAGVWLLVLSRTDISAALPLGTGLYYVLLLLVAQFFLQEKVPLLRWLGAMVILIGIVITTRK